MAIYKIYHTYAIDKEKQAKYIETDMDQEEAANLVVGLQFYIEDHTVEGAHSTITEDHACYLLCHFFGCKESTAEQWNEENMDRLDDYDDDCCIDLFSEREFRCGLPEYYERPIVIIKNTPFIKAICAYFDSPSSQKEEHTAEDIIKQYMSTTHDEPDEVEIIVRANIAEECSNKPIFIDVAVFTDASEEERRLLDACKKNGTHISDIPELDDFCDRMKKAGIEAFEPCHVAGLGGLSLKKEKADEYTNEYGDTITFTAHAVHELPEYAAVIA